MGDTAAPDPGTGESALHWRELTRSIVYERYGRALAEAVYQLPSGASRTFSLKIEPACVAVLALTPDSRVVLTRQFRPGPGRVLYEMPGGYLGPGEDASEAAARELFEETGYAGQVRIAGECYSDAYSSSMKKCAVVTGAVSKGRPRPDSEEFINLSIVTIPQFRSVLRSGQITDVDMGYMGLDFLGLL